MKTTSDGIPLSQWSKVHRIALKISNFTIMQKDSDAKLWQNKMIVLLNNLLLQYGEKSGLIATIADYTNDNDKKIQLWEKAYQIALKTSDYQNMTYVSHSLADFHVRYSHNKNESIKWIGILSSCLNNYTEDFESEDFIQMKNELGL